MFWKIPDFCQTPRAEMEHPRMGDNHPTVLQWEREEPLSLLWSCDIWSHILLIARHCSFIKLKCIRNLLILQVCSSCGILRTSYLQSKVLLYLCFTCLLPFNHLLPRIETSAFFIAFCLSLHPQYLEYCLACFLSIYWMNTWKFDILYEFLHLDFLEEILLFYSQVFPPYNVSHLDSEARDTSMYFQFPYFSFSKAILFVLVKGTLF